MKLVIENPTQSQKRINILNIAGVKQRGEIIIPTNGERIFGNVGQVTFNKQSQQGDSGENISPPPDCPNCQNSPNIEPLPTPVPVSGCFSDCSDSNDLFFNLRVFSAIDNVISSIVANTYKTKFYNEAFEKMLEEVQKPEYILACENTLNIVYNNNTFEDETRKSTVTSVSPFSSRMQRLYYAECYDYLNYSDGSRGSVLSGYDYNITGTEVYAEYSAITYVEYVDKINQRTTRREVKTRAAYISFWGSSNRRCATCYVRTSTCVNPTPIT